jgi:hypothetical protein
MIANWRQLQHSQFADTGRRVNEPTEIAGAIVTRMGRDWQTRLG